MDTWEIGRAPTQEGFLLFVDWLWFLLEESFGSKRIGKSQNKYEIVLGDEQPVAVSYDPGARAARRRTGDVGQGSNSRGIGVCPCMRRAPPFRRRFVLPLLRSRPTRGRLCGDPLFTHWLGKVLAPVAQHCSVDMQTLAEFILGLHDQVDVGMLLVCGRFGSHTTKEACRAIYVA